MLVVIDNAFFSAYDARSLTGTLHVAVAGSIPTDKPWFQMPARWRQVRPKGRIIAIQKPQDMSQQIVFLADAGGPVFSMSFRAPLSLLSSNK